MTSPARVDPPRAAAFSRALRRWFRKNGRDLPWRRTRDAYRVLVSEAMLQRGLDSSTTTNRFPRTASGMGFSFSFTPSSRIDCEGWMNVRPTYRFFTSPSPYGMLAVSA